MVLFIETLAFFFDVGICGSPRAVDIGGVPYLIPSPRMEKVSLMMVK